MVVKDKPRKLRRVDLLKEKTRLLRLLYCYVDSSEDLIIKRMIANIDNELRILEEQKKRTR